MEHSQQCEGDHLESGTWQSVAMETAAKGGRTALPHENSGPGSSMRTGGTKGPMADYGLAAAMGGP
ncbi:unnamed protein product [Staurois parvus]|uniref:Uncharacterized protein n=1 Tax=Staurois parvus TaxID=386267 RepID=A0ABN9C784_9NEOB|nr:unnamed protein product [Staurois parvus]